MNPKILWSSLVVTTSLSFVSASARADDEAETPSPAPAPTPAVPTPTPAPADRPTDTERVDRARIVRQSGTVVLDDMFGFGFVPNSINGVGALAVRGGWFAYSSAKSESSGFGTMEMTSFSFVPSADFFVVDGLSVGGAFGISRTKSTYGAALAQSGGMATTTTLIRRSIAPRVGYAIPVTREILVWPRAFFEVGSSSMDVESSSATTSGLPAPMSSADGSFWAVGADVQAVFVLSRHVLLGVGPRFAYSKETRDDDTPNLGTRLAASSTTLGVNGSLRVAF